jgi:hypothetical protein
MRGDLFDGESRAAWSGKLGDTPANAEATPRFSMHATPVVSFTSIEFHLNFF